MPATISTAQRIRELAESRGWPYLKDYRDPDGYGRKCPGIQCRTHELEAVKRAVQAVGIASGRVDRKGQGYVIYWPSVDSEKGE